MYLGILLFVLSIVLNRILFGKKLLSPGLFFLVNFGLSYMIFSASSFINHDLGSTTITVILLSIAAFSFGALFSSVSNKRKSPNTVTIDKQDSEANYARDFRALTTVFALFLIGFVYCTLYYIFRLGFDEYISNFVRISSTEFTVSPVFFLYLQKLSLVLAVLAPYCLIKHKKKKVYCIIIMCLSILSNVGYQRNNLFYVLSLIILTFTYLSSQNRQTQKQQKQTKQKKQKNKVVFISVALILSGILYFVNTQAQFNKTFMLSGTIFNRNISDAFATPIAYYMGTFASTSKYIAILNKAPFLAYTFRFVINVLRGLGIPFANFNYGVPFVDIPFSFNTALMQFYIYREGGYIWLCIMYFLLGYFAKKWFVNYQKNPSLTNLAKLVYISFVLLFSIREYAFMRIDYIIFFIGFQIVLYVKGKRQKVVK